MNFDKKNGNFMVFAKSFLSLGVYKIYGRISFSLEDDSFSRLNLT
jgi:hypothetical protein